MKNKIKRNNEKSSTFFFSIKTFHNIIVHNDCVFCSTCLIQDIAQFEVQEKKKESSIMMICEMTLPLLFLQADHLFFGKLFSGTSPTP